MDSNNSREINNISSLPNDWELLELGSILSFITDGVHNPPKRTTNGIKFIAGATNIKYLNVDFTNCTYISKEDYDKIHKFYSIEPNDILLTIVGTVGNVAIVKENDLPFSIQRSIALLRSGPLLYYRFLFYWLNSPEFKKVVYSYVNSTAQPGVYLGVIKQFKMPVPKLSEQKAIAKILSGLDSKIELNQKMNETLESIAQAIFKHWFIDFEFPNEEGKPYKSSGGEMVDSELGKVPKKWAIKTLDGIANFLNGLALQRYPAITENDYLPVIKIKEMNYGISGSSDKASRDIPSEYIVHNGDVLFAWSGSLGVTIWCNGEGALNQHIFKISSNEYPKWFYYEWLLYYLPNFIEIARDKATTMGHIQRHHLSESLVAVPDSNTLEIMNNVLKLIIDRIINLKVENDTLTKTRDLFLPSLISGKIRVPLEG